MRYANDARYLTGDRSTDMVRRLHPKQNKVSFFSISSPENRSDPTIVSIIAFEASKNMSMGKRCTLATWASTHLVLLSIALKVNKCYWSQSAEHRYLHIGFRIVRIGDKRTYTTTSKSPNCADYLVLYSFLTKRFSYSYWTLQSIESGMEDLENLQFTK